MRHARLQFIRKIHGRGRQSFKTHLIHRNENHSSNTKIETPMNDLDEAERNRLYNELAVLRGCKFQRDALRSENEELKSILIEYHRAEEAYKAVGSTERYGRYQAASEQLTKLAKRLADKQRN